MYFPYLNSETYTTKCVFFLLKQVFKQVILSPSFVFNPSHFCLPIEKEIRMYPYLSSLNIFKKKKNKRIDTWSLSFCKRGRKPLPPQSQLPKTILHQMRKVETPLKSKGWFGPQYNNKQYFIFLKVLILFQILLYF